MTMKFFLFLMQHWRGLLIAVLCAMTGLYMQVARMRGIALTDAKTKLAQERQEYETRLTRMEKAIQDERERNNMRRRAAKKLNLADAPKLDFDTGSRDVYDGLRARQQDKRRG